jgi:apolipoprotein D and lipocalin family protein
MISRRNKLWLAATAILGSAAAVAVAARKPAAPLRTAALVDLDRYLGQWYEIARLPARFEKDMTHVMAEYRRDADGGIEVLNSGQRDGKRKTATGHATVTDDATNAKLEVSFFWPFEGNYWILELDPDYRWVLVGEPSRQYLWILSREPRLAPEIVRNLVARARADGFPVDQLIFTKQD